MNENRGTTHALILYDPTTGVIGHTLLETTMDDPPTPDWAAMETRLSALVKQQDPASARLGTLRSGFTGVSMDMLFLSCPAVSPRRS